MKGICILDPGPSRERGTLLVTFFLKSWRKPIFILRDKEVMSVYHYSPINSAIVSVTVKAEIYIKMDKRRLCIRTSFHEDRSLWVNIFIRKIFLAMCTQYVVYTHNSHPRHLRYNCLIPFWLDLTWISECFLFRFKVTGIVPNFVLFVVKKNIHPFPKMYKKNPILRLLRKLVFSWT